MKIIILLSSLVILDMAMPLSRAAEKTQPPLEIHSNDGQLVAKLVPNGILITACDGNTLIRKLDHCAPVTGTFSKDNSLFCAAGRCVGGYGSVKVWRISDGKLLCMLDNDMIENPRINFSNDSTLLACTTARSRINLWAISDATLKWSTSVNRGIAFLSFDDKDAKVVVECADHSTRLLSVQNGQLVPGK